MLIDGIYELLYRSEREPGSTAETLLMVLREGNLLGSDRWGGVFLGRYEFDGKRRKQCINVRLQVPPGGTLITDNEPHADGCVVDIAFELDAGFQRAAGVVDLAGKPVMIELLYIGSVP